MKTFIVSDIHFSHANIIKFCPESRPFANAQEMDESIINIWNNTVSPEDHTIILGDVAFCHWEKAVGYIKRMNGTKSLIVGNHDKKLLKSREFRECFTNIADYKAMEYNGHKLVLFHFPIYEWDRMHHGAIHFHGHLHARKIPVSGRIFDVAMDGNKCVPYELDSLIKRMIQLPIRKHGDGEN